MPDLSTMSLYQKMTCPYCLRVLWAMKKLGLHIELRSTFDAHHRADLIAGGGRSMVPCLRIDHPDGRTQWMYESADIIDYLKTLGPGK